MYQYINTFDIVKANYTDLNGDEKVGAYGTPQKGLFLVLNVHNSNVLCAKITSQYGVHTQHNCYKLRVSNHPFLVSDSWVQFDKLHTFSVSNCSRIGDVAYSERLQVIETFTEFFGFLRMFMQKFAPHYTSPNVRRNNYYGSNDRNNYYNSNDRSNYRDSNDRNNHYTTRRSYYASRDNYHDNNERGSYYESEED